MAKCPFLTIYLFIYIIFWLLQVASKVAKIVADASPELVDDVKLFFINLFQSSAEYVIHDFSFFFCPVSYTMFDNFNARVSIDVVMIFM